MYFRRFIAGLTAVWLIAVMPALSGGKAYAADVCGQISSNTIWDITGSPYIIKCGIIIQQGVTLTIEPGVQVKFDGEYSIQVDGILNAQGTAGNMISFTSNKAIPSSQDWGNIHFTNTGDGILEYCKIEYGGRGDKSSVYIDSSAPVINRCTITNCEGGIYAYYANNLQITNNTITNNSSFYKGGIFSDYGSLTISGNTISGNSTSSSGGGIRSYYGIVSISGNTITSNSASGNGGGIFADHSDVTITNNIITSNSASGNGGAISSSSGALIISGNRINGNLTSGTGGAISSSSGTLTISGNNISGNSASDDGGGIRLYYSGVIISGNNIYSNSSYSGAGISSVYGSVTISGNAISNNSSSDDGGGIRCWSGTVTISGNTISNNSTVDIGGAIFTTASGAIIDNILQNNQAGICGGIYLGAGLPVINNNCLMNIGRYELYNNTANVIDATGNYWNTTDQIEITDKIYDWNNNIDKGLVAFAPWRGACGMGTLIPVAGFMADNTDVIPGDTVTFTDLSCGDVALWRWNFGDGQVSRQQNPTHSYNGAGEYTVSLTVGGPGSTTDTITLTDYIKVYDPVSLDITLNQAVFTTGDTITADYALTNDSPNTVQVELKLWQILPSKRKDPLQQPHTRKILAPHETITEQFYNYTFTGSEPAGDYKIGGMAEDPILGADYQGDRALFSFAP